MADTLTRTFPDIEVELIESSGGAFEVTVEGQLIFSKLAEGRHPTDEEIIAAIA